MLRIALGVAYDGSAYYGFQYQHQLTTIQYILNQALSKIADEPINVIGAGRTDAGVHALGQVVHFDTHAIRKDYSWVSGGNTLLPPDVAIQWAKTVDSSFHARFTALKRHYRYCIYNHSVRLPTLHHRVLEYSLPLNENFMAAAAHHLLGEHDFSSFRGADCQAKTPIRHVEMIQVKREGPFIFIDIIANSFLHHMVRNIVGVLLEIGRGRRPIDWMLEVLNACDRTKASMTVPPQGLYLLSISYPSLYDFPTISCQALCQAFIF
jgi:tRNA pseudouridine38-40 synthase